MRRLDEQPCFFSVWGEFGLTLQRITNPKASAADLFLKKALHDVYSLSGRDGYAGVTAYSDAENNTHVVQGPSVTIIGESTPGAFFDCLDSSLVASGLVPRLLAYEYRGDHPPTNPDAGYPPPDSLVRKLADLASTALQMQAENRFEPVRLDQDATEILHGFDSKVDAVMNAAGDNEPLLQAWNRAHLNALKVASLLAVGCDHCRPLVTVEHAEWAIKFVKRSVHTMLSPFQRGEAGASDATKAEAEVRKKVEEFYRMTPEQRAHERYGIPKELRGGVVFLGLIRFGGQLDYAACLSVNRLSNSAGLT